MRPAATALLLLLLRAMAAAPGAGAEECGPSKFRCGDGACIAGSWVCDGRAECRDGSDETPELCRSRSCPPSEFSCGGRQNRCVPSSWRCDGHHDCDNGADELDCPPHSCPPDQLLCGGVSPPLCVSRAFACDGERDCPDGADEARCPPPPRCGPHQLRCASDGRCLPLLWGCDGDRDCPDGSDEWPQRCGPPRPPPPCPPLRFACRSGECLPRRWRCDGGRDCRDGSDEEGCDPPTCRPDQFSCGDGRCVPGGRQCDGEADCADGSDEEGCHNVTACDGHHEFKCRSGECVPTERLCDGRRDCRDWSDEPIKECGVNECLEGNGGCSHVCSDLRVGYKCLCPRGFELRPDGTTCQDIDECRDPQTCSQLCHNLPGSYKCDCGGGYRMDPHTGACRALGPPAALLFTNRHEIRRLALDGGGYGRLVGALKHAAALDADAASGTVYWADRAQGKIYRLALADGSRPVTVIGTGLGTPEGIALDWVHQNIYWTDSQFGTVSVADTGGTRRRTLVREAGAKPRAIAVDPLHGYMYWTDWGANAKIAKGGLNGVDQFPLVTESVEWPNGITLDLPSQRLYWVDARLHTLSSVDVDGGHRRTLLADPRVLARPFAITVFEDTVFWTDVLSDAIFSANRRTGGDVRTVARDLFSPEDIVLLHPLRQPPDPSATAPTDTAPTTPSAPPQPPTSSGDPHSHGAPPGPTSATSATSATGATSTTGNATAGGSGDAVGHVGSRTGPTALAVVLPLVLLVLAAFAARGLWRGWRRRSTNSISFTNPVYRKTTEDDEEPLGRGQGGFSAPSHQVLTLDDTVA